MPSNYDKLVSYLNDIHNLDIAHWVLHWDQNTHMPPQGAKARAAQMATLQGIRHERLTGDELGKLLELAENEVDMDAFDSIPTSMIRVAKRDRKNAMVLPTDFVAEYTQATNNARTVWEQAKKANDYALFLPAMQKVFDIKMREADIRGYKDHPYDTFLNKWEGGITTNQVRAIFEEQRPHLVELVTAINEVADRVDDSILHQPFDLAKQREFSIFVSTQFGFDYDNWATFDVTAHPFCTQIATGDIRLTTRFNDNFFNPAFYGTLHETGHGLHGQGFAPELDGTFLSDMEIFSQAVCESQSRTWENLVGRSREFWEWLHPIAQKTFPAQFGKASADDLYKAVNKTRAQFIRVEADELTYNLHIMLRFELELDIVDGKLSLQDAPTAWNDKIEEFFGIRPANDAEGILQDIHWGLGGMGAFVGYALGNVLSVQYYNQALKAHPNIPQEIAKGDFSTLRTWLTENIYTHGRKYTADELTRRVTGEGMQSRDYVAYLKTKFTDLYDLRSM